MNDQQFDDLKQFIDSRISQSEKLMRNELDSRISRTEEKLVQKIDDMELKVDTISTALNEHLNEHEVRLKKLEQQTT